MIHNDEATYADDNDSYYNSPADYFKDQDSIYPAVVKNIIDSIAIANASDTNGIKITQYILNRHSLALSNGWHSVYSFSYVTNKTMNYGIEYRPVGTIVIRLNYKTGSTYRKLIYPITNIYIENEFDYKWNARVINDTNILYKKDFYSGHRSAKIFYDEYFVFNNDTVKCIGDVTVLFPAILPVREPEVLRNIVRRNLGHVDRYVNEEKYPEYHYYYEVDSIVEDEDYNIIEKLHYYEDYIVTPDTLILNRYISDDEWKAMFDRTKE